MDLRALRYLIAVAEEGHFTRAAERCFVSQPALSQQIRKLEEAIGEVLVDRSTTPVRLTVAGEVVVAHARRMLAELEAMHVALEELQGLQRGSLAVGAVHTVQAYLIPQVVTLFIRKYPGMRLQVMELPADAVELGVLEGRFQLGLGFVPPTREGLEAKPLFEEELVLIVSPVHPLATRQRITLSELETVELVLLPTTYCTRRLWDRWAQTAGLEPRVVLEVNTIEGLLYLVRTVGLATVLPELTLRLDTAGGLRAVRLPLPAPRRMVGVLHRQGAYRCRATQAFEAILDLWLATVRNGHVLQT